MRVKNAVNINKRLNLDEIAKKRGRFPTDLRGRKFRHLTVLKRGPDCKGRNKITWECQCDCGNITIVRTGSLKNGSSGNCYNCWKSKSLAFGEAAFNRLCNQYKQGAIQRNLSFDLSKDDIKNITKQNCFYCGIPPTQIANPAKGNNGGYVYNGIDRKDNTLGYTLENAVACCVHCNFSKRERTVTEFVDWIIKAYNFLSKKKAA